MRIVTKLREMARDRGMSDWENGNINMIIAFLVVAIVLGIGVTVLYSVETATPTIANSSGWYSTQSQLTTTASSGYGLLGITLIVMAAVAILGTLFVLVPRGD